MRMRRWLDRRAVCAAVVCTFGVATIANPPDWYKYVPESWRGWRVAAGLCEVEFIAAALLFIVLISGRER